LKDLKKKTFKGILWSFIDQAGNQFIGFIITLFLARMLGPEEFGLVAMGSVVIAITRIFIESGLSDSLIQKKNCTHEDFSTVFLFNILVGVVLFLVIFFSAPALANFFRYPQLTPIIRLLGIKPFISSFAFVQVAILKKELRFKAIAKITFPAFLLSGLIGLTMAWFGFGVWSLVIQSLLETILINIFLWINSEWQPKLIFNKVLFRFHWQHGSRLLVISALGAIYRNVFSLVIGKFFSVSQLGFYNRADSFRTIIMGNTVGIVQSVSYPVLVKFQDNDELLKRNYRKIQRFTMMIILPIAGFFIIAAEPVIRFLLTDKWLPAAPILKVLMLALLFSPFNSINLNILKVKRRTDLLLRTDIINKMALISFVLIAVNLGFDYLVMTNLFIAVFGLFINNYYTNKLISYSIIEQFKDLIPLILAFVFSILIAWQLNQHVVFESEVFNSLAVGFVIVTTYILLIFLFNRSFFLELKDTFNYFSK
jgi:O-antigen/teichoic acid export membrane protein